MNNNENKIMIINKFHHFINRYYPVIRLFLIIACVFSLFYFGRYVTLNSVYPTGTDELFYFLNTKSSFENNSAKASITFQGYGAKLSGGDAHGASIPMLYAKLSTCIGFSNYTIILFNVIFASLSFLLIFLITKGQFLNKLLVISLLLLYPLQFYWLFSYHQEALTLFFSTIVFCLIYKIFTSNNRIFIALFIIFILVASTFKPTWLFFLASLIPLAKNKRQTVAFVFLYVSILVTSYLIIGSLFETFNYSLSWGNIIHEILNGEVKKGILKAGYRTLFAFDLIFLGISRNFSFLGIVFRSLIILSICYLGYIGFNRNNKFALGLFLPLGIYFIVNMIYFDPASTIRYFLPAFVFVIMYSLINSNRSILPYVAILYGITFYFNFRENDVFFQRRNEEILLFSNEIEEIKYSYQNIGKFINQDKQLVLIDYLPQANILPLSFLPVKTESNIPIRYAIRFYSGEFNHHDLGFILTERDVAPGKTLKIDYNLEIIQSNRYYDLYKVKRD
jgi:hypothetical protein